MTDIEKLKELAARLRDADRNSQQRILGSDIFREAADAVDALLASLASKDAEIERLKAKYEGKRAPVQGFTGGIPWEMHLRAYDVYCKKYGEQYALIDLEGRGCRGGFGTYELDRFIPGWRDELSERTTLIARAESAESRLTAALAALGEAREALEPFSDADEYLEAETSGFVDDDPLTLTYRNEEACATDIGTVLSFGRFRKARAALAKLNALEGNSDD